MLILNLVPRAFNSHARFSKWWLVRPWSSLGHVVHYLQKNLGDFYHILRSGEVNSGISLLSMFFVFRLQIFPGSVFDSSTYR